MKEKKSLWKTLTASREASLLIVLILLCAAISIKSPAFLTFKSITDMLKNNAVVMIMALGMLSVLLIGGIDISIMSTLALSGMIIGMLAKYKVVTSTPILFAIAIAVGILCGAVVGLTAAYGRVLPIIATMGFMYIYRGLAYIISNSEWASADNLGSFKDFGTGRLFGVYYVIWVALVIYIVFYVVMKWTRIGRQVYAVGSNKEAALISGINTKRVTFLVYTVMGTLAGLGGALAVSIYASAQPNMLYGKEMDVIAACVIGGVSMSGGRGSVLGVLMGSIILAVIAKALPLVGIDSIAQNTVKGVIIMSVVILNVIAQLMMEKNVRKEREM
ncbi:MAG: ABC transporter permease [Lachnospiraceae bacterium]|nr:ABC transporter permease [Lachnospiraceae bacterium]MDY5741545.1 ABC transporter permease [Lachnospiraceae bacterium]